MNTSTTSNLPSNKYQLEVILVFSKTIFRVFSPTKLGTRLQPANGCPREVKLHNNKRLASDLNPPLQGRIGGLEISHPSLVPPCVQPCPLVRAARTTLPRQYLSCPSKIHAISPKQTRYLLKLILCLSQYEYDTLLMQYILKVKRYISGNLSETVSCRIKCPKYPVPPNKL